MSLVMFAAIGLNPVSTAIAGALIGINVTVLLVCSGILMTVFTLFAAFSLIIEIHWKWSHLTAVPIRTIS